MRKLAQNSYWE